MPVPLSNQFKVWSSRKGDGLYTSTYTAHLVNPTGDRTFCGKPKGKMTTKYTTFNVSNGDCKRCAKAAQAFIEKNGEAL